MHDGAMDRAMMWGMELWGRPGVFPACPRYRGSHQIVLHVRSSEDENRTGARFSGEAFAYAVDHLAYAPFGVRPADEIPEPLDRQALGQANLVVTLIADAVVQSIQKSATAARCRHLHEIERPRRDEGNELALSAAVLDECLTGRADGRRLLA